MTKDNVLNGINVTKLTETIDSIRKNPEIAKFKFRATNQWMEGTHNRATVKDFYGALQEDTSRKPLVFEIDEPPVLLGNNVGANPVEYVLVGLSGCLTTSLVAQAAIRGIEIKGLSTRLEGDLDLRGFLGISEDVKVGYEGIRVYFKIDADIPEAKKEELVRLAAKYSPVYNTVANPVPVAVLQDFGRRLTVARPMTKEGRRDREVPPLFCANRRKRPPTGKCRPGEGGPVGGTGGGESEAA